MFQASSRPTDRENSGPNAQAPSPIQVRARPLAPAPVLPDLPPPAGPRCKEKGGGMRGALLPSAAVSSRARALLLTARRSPRSLLAPQLPSGAPVSAPAVCHCKRPARRPSPVRAAAHGSPVAALPSGAPAPLRRPCSPVGSPPLLPSGAPARRLPALLPSGAPAPARSVCPWFRHCKEPRSAAGAGVAQCPEASCCFWCVALLWYSALLPYLLLQVCNLSTQLISACGPWHVQLCIHLILQRTDGKQ